MYHAMALPGPLHKPGRAPSGDALVYASNVPAHWQNIGNEKNSGFRINITKQQSKHQCVINVPLLLQAKHSTVTATRKITMKTNS